VEGQGYAASGEKRKEGREILICVGEKKCCYEASEGEGRKPGGGLTGGGKNALVLR